MGLLEIVGAHKELIKFNRGRPIKKSIECIGKKV